MRQLWWSLIHGFVQCKATSVSQICNYNIVYGFNLLQWYFHILGFNYCKYHPFGFKVASRQTPTSVVNFECYVYLLVLQSKVNVYHANNREA